ncbi:hypothetical protein MBLNU457_5950t1 [Dothideomycetes sp. NU457]
MADSMKDTSTFDSSAPPPYQSTPGQATSYYSPLSSAKDDNDSYSPCHLPDNVSIDSRAPLNAQYAPSIAPSESASIRPTNINSAGNAKWGPGSAYGHKDEEAYMNALRAWAEDKKYMSLSDPKQQVDGFYGSRTMDDVINSGEPLSFRRRRRGSASKVPAAGGRRKSSAVAIPEEAAVGVAPGGGVDTEEERRLREEDVGREETQDTFNTNKDMDASTMAPPVKERRRSSIGNLLRRVRTGEKI